MKRPALRLPIAAAILVSTFATSTAAATARAGRPVMGTVFQVTVVAADDGSAERLAALAVAEAERWDDVLTTWRPEGELARLNARAGQGPTKISVDLAAALLRMKKLWQATGGAFDPAVGPLVDRWRDSGRPPTRPIAPPSGPFQMNVALDLRGRQATLAAGAALDAGGIGKGIALDAIAALLRRNGAEAAFLDFGGSSQLAFGPAPGNPAGWPIAVAGLLPGSLLGILHLSDGAISTSRASGPGAAAGPIVDPRREAPVEAPRLATVQGPDATATEAWSTALVVLGRAGLGSIEAASLEALYEDASGVMRTAGFRLAPGSPTPLAPN